MEEGENRKPSGENEINIINYFYCIVMMQPLTKILQCINKELDFCNELQILYDLKTLMF